MLQEVGKLQSDLAVETASEGRTVSATLSAQVPPVTFEEVDHIVQLLTGDGRHHPLGGPNAVSREANRDCALVRLATLRSRLARAQEASPRQPAVLAVAPGGDSTDEHAAAS